MYPEELEKLIGYAIADGTLTDSKRQILLKKAASLGIDLDEFQLVLDGRLFERKNTTPPTSQIPTTPTPAVKTQKYGDVRKCPACGALVPAFSIKCPECGYEFSDVKANSSIRQLFEMINQAENEKNEYTTNHPLKAFISQNFLSRATDPKTTAIIANFPIPTTKDDILEFLALAVPRAKKVGNFITAATDVGQERNMFVPVWKAKCEQIIIKARFLFSDDRSILDEINKYAREIGMK